MDSTQSQSEDFRSPARWNSVPVPERVARRAYERVDVNEDGCWISQYSTASHGYSQIGWQEGGSRHIVLGHRAAWVHVNGQMPLGMTIDHVCKTRRCVNPDHLRMLPNYENARRVSGKDWPIGYCAQGHPNSDLVEQRWISAGRRGPVCAKCRSIYIGRSNWRARHPGEPMPERLLLASEKDGSDHTPKQEIRRAP